MEPSKIHTVVNLTRHAATSIALMSKEIARYPFTEETALNMVDTSKLIRLKAPGRHPRRPSSRERR